MSAGLLSLDLAIKRKNFFLTNLVFIAPALLVFIATVTQFSGFEISIQDEGLAVFIADFIFLNNSHAVLSLAAIFFIRAAIAVVKHKYNHFVFMTLSFIILLTGAMLFIKADSNNKVYIEMLFIYVSFWHSMKQTYGIARIHSIKYLEEKKTTLEVNFEKFILYMILSVSVFLNPRILARYQDYFNYKVNTEYIYNLSMNIMALLFFLLIAVNLRHVKSFKSFLLKILYLLPNLVFPFAVVSLMGVVLLRAVHGVQACFVYQNLYESTSASAQQKRNFLQYSLLIMIFQTIVFTFMYDESQNSANILFSIISLLISYLHLYHERFLFKLENQPIRSI